MLVEQQRGAPGLDVGCHDPVPPLQARPEGMNRYSYPVEDTCSTQFQRPACLWTGRRGRYTTVLVEGGGFVEDRTTLLDWGEGAMPALPLCTAG